MKVNAEFRIAALNKLLLSIARDDQDIVLTISSPSSASARIDQDIVLAIVSNFVAPATKLMSWTDPAFGFTPRIIRNSGLYIPASNAVFIAAQSSVTGHGRVDQDLLLVGFQLQASIRVDQDVPLVAVLKTSDQLRVSQDVVLVALAKGKYLVTYVVT